MKKKPISVTLSADNLVWLRGRTLAERNRSLSDTLDRLVTHARSGRDGRLATARSVVGSVAISEQDPNLSTADSVVRDLFARSLSQTDDLGAVERELGADRVAERRSRG